MSYILDALKKSQAEQASDGVVLRVQPDRAKRSLAPWLGAGLGIVLVVNAALLGWIFLKDDTPSSTASQAKPQIETPAQSERVANAPTNVATIAPTAPATQTQATSLPTTLPTTTQTEKPAKEPVQKYALENLPSDDQILYNGFRYSTHIYTDDPSLCAIVVDGQRLKAGDSFKGLKVIAITEAGIVFEENRRGVSRQVEVSVLAQWEK